jgi:hypothetical protein
MPYRQRCRRTTRRDGSPSTLHGCQSSSGRSGPTRHAALPARAVEEGNDSFAGGPIPSRWRASLHTERAACKALGRTSPLVLFLAADVRNIVVFLIAMLDQDGTVEVIIVIIVHLGQHARLLLAVGFLAGILGWRE